MRCALDGREWDTVSDKESPSKFSREKHRERQRDEAINLKFIAFASSPSSSSSSSSSSQNSLERQHPPFGVPDSGLFRFAKTRDTNGLLESVSSVAPASSSQVVEES